MQKAGLHMETHSCYVSAVLLKSHHRSLRCCEPPGFESCHLGFTVKIQHLRTSQPYPHYACSWVIFLENASQHLKAVILLWQGSQYKTVDSGFVIHVIFPLLSSDLPRYYRMTGLECVWPDALLARIQLSQLISCIFSSYPSFLFNLFFSGDIIQSDLRCCQHSMCLFHND